MLRTRSTFASAAAALIVASGTVIAANPTARADDTVLNPPTSTRSAATNSTIESRMLGQVILEEAAIKIQNTATSQGDRGFTAISIDPVGQTVTLLWKHGVAIPSDVQRVIDAYVAAGTSVSTSQAAYSEDELDQAGTDLIAAETQAGVPMSQRATQIWPADDGSGLELRTATDTEGDPTLEGLRDQFPVVSVTEDGASTPLIGRLDDTPRYWGGARIVMLENAEDDFGKGCTSAFAVNQGSGENLLSARALRRSR